MTALSQDKKTEYREGVELPFPVDDGDKIYAGALACVNADGYLVPGSDTAGLIFEGVSREAADNSSGEDGDVSVSLRRRGLFKMTLGHSITQANVGDSVFIVDDQTVDLAANVTNLIFCGVIAGYIDATHAWIDIEPAIKQADVATHIADASGAHAASAISLADEDELFTADDAEAALAEVMAGLKTAQYTLFPQLICLEDGTALGKFADGASGVGWTQLSNKELALRWNNAAAPDKVALQFVMPQDINDAAAVVLHLVGAIVKAGADEADSPVFTVEAYFSTPGAVPAADDNCGGESGEFVTAEDDKFQEKTLSIAHGDVPAAPAVLTLVINPKDGQLQDDDFILLTPWLEITRKALTA